MRRRGVDLARSLLPARRTLLRVVLLPVAREVSTLNIKQVALRYLASQGAWIPLYGRKTWRVMAGTQPGWLGTLLANRGLPQNARGQVSPSQAMVCPRVASPHRMDRFASHHPRSTGIHASVSAVRTSKTASQMHRDASGG